MMKNPVISCITADKDPSGRGEGRIRSDWACHMAKFSYIKGRLNSPDLSVGLVLLPKLVELFESRVYMKTFVEWLKVDFHAIIVQNINCTGMVKP
jgi:hypothetical protein